MRKIYYQYDSLEDFKCGMWRKLERKEEKECLQKAIEFTSDHIKYGLAMMRVIREWPLTCEHNLTDKSINYKAFIGHCAVTLQIGIPEYITRLAWSYLTQEQQDRANERAEYAYSIWKLDHVSKKLKCSQDVIRF